MTDELKLSPEAVRVALSRVQETDLWSDTVCALVGGAFETVSRNPSDHESAEAFRRAIAAALVIDRALRPATMPGDVVEAARAMWPLINSDLTFEEAAAIKDDAGYAWVMDLATAALTAMQPAIQAAVDALEPFAEMAKWLDDVKDRRDAIYCGGSPGLRCEITQADYHRAHQALATLRTVTEQEEGCAHAWEYQGYDRAGSHKGEDRYKCCKCKKIEYRHD